MGRGLMVFQCLSGMSIVSYYGPLLISNATSNQKGACSYDKVITDQTIRDAIFWGLPLRFVKILGTIIAIQDVDSWDRRRVLSKNFHGIFVCTLLLTTCFWLFCSADAVWIGQVSGISSDCLLLVTYNAGLDTIPFQLTWEFTRQH